MNPYFDSLHKFKKDIIESLKNIKLTQLDPEVYHSIIVPNTTYNPWLENTEFIEIYNLIKDHTLVDVYRCFCLYNSVIQHPHIKGDIVEIGVWRGGTAALLSKALQKISLNEKVYLFDTFKGVVKASQYDTIYRGGEHSDTTPLIVEKLLKKLNLNNFKIFEGIFPNEINFEKLNLKLKIKLVHIDVDTYQSAKDCFLYVWKYVVRGGIVIFDDYGFYGCEGVTKFVNELKLKN